MGPTWNRGVEVQMCVVPVAEAQMITLPCSTTEGTHSAMHTLSLERLFDIKGENVELGRPSWGSERWKN